MENELKKWPSMYIPHDSDKPEPETIIGFWHTGGRLVMNEIERGTTPTKCDFCKAWSHHTWYSKYGVIHACNYHWDRLSLVDVLNTDKHWKQIKRRVG